MIAEKRNSNLELLRLICMLMITLHHLTFTVGIESTNMYIRLWGQFFFIGGKVGVNCFVLVSAYFLCDSEFNIYRIFKTHNKLILYGVVGILTGCVFMKDLINPLNLLKSCFPVIFNHYWFVTTYIGMLFVMPILNLLLDNISKKQHMTIILICLFLFSVIPTFTAQTVFNCNLGWFCFLYILVAYIKWNRPCWSFELSKWYVCPFMWLLIWSASVVFTIGEQWIPYLREGTNFFTGMYIIPQLINSLSLFLFFEKKILTSNIINFAARHTLACYLLQSNCILIILREKLFLFLFSYTSSWLYPIVSISICIIILIFSILVDSVLGKIMNINAIKCFENKCINIVNNLYKKILYSLIE